MSGPRAALIYAPFPDAESARDVAAHLLEKRIIACANILNNVESVFLYDGKIENANEVGVIFKTTESFLDQAIVQLAALHPYETPAIVGSVCDAAHAGTLEWLAAQTGDRGNSGQD